MYNNNIPHNYGNMQRPNRPNYNNNNGDRIFGGFAIPFVLGGITGGLIANNRPNYPVYYPYYPYYPSYRPYPYYQNYPYRPY